MEPVSWRSLAAASLAGLLTTAAPAVLSANGHGPLFGGATPTLGKGG